MKIISEIGHRKKLQMGLSIVPASAKHIPEEFIDPPDGLIIRCCDDNHTMAFQDPVNFIYKFFRALKVLYDFCTDDLICTGRFDRKMLRIGYNKFSIGKGSFPCKLNCI
jgi:hypothetical protein